METGGRPQKHRKRDYISEIHSIASDLLDNSTGSSERGDEQGNYLHAFNVYIESDLNLDRTGTYIEPEPNVGEDENEQQSSQTFNPVTNECGGFSSDESDELVNAETMQDEQLLISTESNVYPMEEQPALATRQQGNSHYFDYRATFTPCMELAYIDSDATIHDELLDLLKLFVSGQFTKATFSLVLEKQRDLPQKNPSLHQVTLYWFILQVFPTR
jgi:hypothetical protein